MKNVLHGEVADLQMFGDPFEEFGENMTDNAWVAEMVRKGKSLRVIRREDGSVSISGHRERYKDFRALIVGPRFADLERLATMQRHWTRSHSLDHEVGEGEQVGFLPNRGEIWQGDDENPLSFESASKLLETRVDHLRVCVINGVAGVGKTKLIERIVRERAHPRSYKSGKPLLLHVESLGKVLTALDDRIAGTLENLRANFVGAELKPLIRRGAIQVAIDGFDELSDNRGYARAWGALREFIRDLDDQGVCILAGRDTMLDERSVREGLGAAVEASSITFLNVRHPDPVDIRQWLEKQPSWKNRLDELKLVEDQAEELEYLRRPFFVQKIAGLDPSQFADMGGEPLAALIDGMVDRESKKMIPGSSPEIESQHVNRLYVRILAEAARLMMDDETSGIDIDYLRMLVEESFADVVSKETVDALVQRAETLALFDVDPRDEAVRVFPHENIKSFFFAKSVVEYMPKHGAMNALYRVPLSLEDFRIFNLVVRSLSNERHLRVAMLELLKNASSQGYFGSNMYGLLLAFLPHDDDASGENVSVSNQSLQDVWLADQGGVQVGDLANCEVSRLDVGAADLSKVNFHEVHVYELVAKAQVKFGDSAPDVDVLVDDGRKIFDPTEIEKWIDSHSRSTGSIGSHDDRFELLEKLARMSMRQYWMFDREGEGIKKLMRHEGWQSLVQLLLDNDRLKISNKVHAAGPACDKYHLVAGADFLARDPDQKSTATILRALSTK